MIGKTLIWRLPQRSTAFAKAGTRITETSVDTNCCKAASDSGQIGAHLLAADNQAYPGMRFLRANRDVLQKWLQRNRAPGSRTICSLSTRRAT
jgi:hypothetical protein